MSRYTTSIIITNYNRAKFIDRAIRSCLDQLLFRDIDTEIIVASIRNPLHVLEAAMIGADIATIPFAVIEQLIKHPLSDIGVERFLKDWEKVEKKEQG